MKALFPLAVALLLGSAATVNAQNQEAPAAAESPARPAPKLSPKQQITGFYAMCKQGRGGEGLREMLSSNPVVKAEDVQKVADAFAQMISQMGAFIDFKIVKETEISERTLVLRSVAHFERQPFVNEFTFYDPGSGDWRLVHLRYDANLATMFQDEIRNSSSGGGN
ncbi:MAG: hypothetical protein KDN19_05325 [Verrucomicrobiae bacterium]|nr:hypothetical protein [Verrucomicrobiae bacterium]